VNVGATFAKARAEDRGVLVGYLPAGFPSVERGIAAILAMVDAGVDVVEIGFPYSDPSGRPRPRSPPGCAAPTCCAPSRPWRRPGYRRSS